jgi:hypothetical protein
MIIDPEIEYNDAQTCLQNGYLYKKARSTTGKAILYPNPATDEINIVCNVPEKSVLYIMDALGKIIQTRQLDHNSFKHILSVSAWQNGCYTYRILKPEGEIVDVGQFIISR